MEEDHNYNELLKLVITINQHQLSIIIAMYVE